MKCEKCGAEIHNLLMNHFDYNGSDSFISVPIVEEQDTGAVIVDVESNWTGNELTEEEQVQEIECPVCRQFPFQSEEIQTYDFIRVVCFVKSGEEKNENRSD